MAGSPMLETSKMSAASTSHRKAWGKRIQDAGLLFRHPTHSVTSYVLLIILALSALVNASAVLPTASLDFLETAVIPQRRSSLESADQKSRIHWHMKRDDNYELDDDEPTSFQMPRAFDANVGNNFTSPACKAWFESFINNIEPCHPVSLMLQTSMSFFDAAKSLVTITRVLDTSCAINHDQCSAVMARFSGEILSSDICLQDYQLGNPIAVQAYAGLVAYDPLYAATCLKDTDTSEGESSNYCYAQAVTNSSTPSASYVYYLPLGFSLPGGAIPTCDTCLRKTMQSFASFAINTTQPLSTTYSNAASAVNMFCGPDFAESIVGPPNTGVSSHSYSIMTIVLAAAVSSALSFL